MSAPGIACCCTAASSVSFQPSVGSFNYSDLATQIISSGAWSQHSLHGSVLLLKSHPAWHPPMLHTCSINVDVCPVLSSTSQHKQSNIPRNSLVLL